ncbi:serine hydrolase domain-containing protein [Nocardia sp. NBC_00565]|uniref:serine hydrolase domain-containing protein n=1 Tax=Nocardia sp. NBC_00565 TaxID=2975993 RepID=UPI002E803441|nr:serine hydrolase domain-containing protein [Nocardia sp. NBC_00565]
MTTDVRGSYDARFVGVAQALVASLDADDVGASAAVYVDGEPVVDIWGGYVDVERTVMWEADTIVNVWSTTKTMVALCALILADRGELDLHAPVARYWPEFAAAGKHDVLVRHLLGHTAGLPVWDDPVAAADLYSWPTVTARLAGQAPQWEPGTEGGYHSITFGFLVGEVIARVTGRSVGTFFAEEVAAPLGADFHIGLAPEHDHRVAALIPAPEGDRPEGFSVGVSDANTATWRRAEIARPRPCPGTADPLGHGLSPRGSHLLVGRMGRLPGPGRFRAPDDGVVCDEPGAVDRRQYASAEHPDRCLRCTDRLTAALLSSKFALKPS